MSTATLAELRNKICSDLNRMTDGDMTASVEDEIRVSIKSYEKERFRFLEERATASTVDGEEFVALPSNFRDMDSLKITVGTNSYTLTEQSYTTLEAWASSANEGQPTDYAIYGEQIRLYPIPNDAYTLTMSYYKELDELTATNSGNAWTNDGQLLIRSTTLQTLYSLQIKDYDAAQAASVTVDRELARHRRITAENLHTGYTRGRR